MAVMAVTVNPETGFALIHQIRKLCTKCLSDRTDMMLARITQTRRQMMRNHNCFIGICGGKQRMPNTRIELFDIHYSIPAC